MDEIKSGKDFFNDFIGGIEPDIITTIYGPAGSGKTNICILAMIPFLKKGKKVFYVDTESNFSIERFKQIEKDLELLKNVFFFKPLTFIEQKKVFSMLKEMVDSDTGLIIVDTLSMLYRLELGENGEYYSANKELARQLSMLRIFNKEYSIPVLMTNQVYSDFEKKDAVKIVGGDLMRYGSKCMIELQNLNNKKKAILHKHRSHPVKEILFSITESGIEILKE